MQPYIATLPLPPISTWLLLTTSICSYRIVLDLRKWIAATQLVLLSKLEESSHAGAFTSPSPNHHSRLGRGYDGLALSESGVRRGLELKISN